MATSVSPPDLNIPYSDATVDVSIINTTWIRNMPASAFMEPQMAGAARLDTPAYSFSIKHKNSAVQTKYDHIIFDLAVRKDFYENAPKAVIDVMEKYGAKIEIEGNVNDVLRDNGEDLSKVGGIVWSHYHLDHNGDPSKFPSSTDLIVGPGFKKALLPGFPEDPNSQLDSKAWEGRTLREIDFDAEGDGLRIGEYKALDFYGDGSFYLLNTPGHAIGHVCGLARVSAEPAEFILMGGDIAHHAGEFRPTQYLPLPSTIQPNPLVAPYAQPNSFCPGHIFEAIHPRNSSSEPFMNISTTSPTHRDHQIAQQSLDSFKDFDAYENIFSIIAHDKSLFDVMEFYPKTANEWRRKGWKEQGRWRFLADFETGENQ